MGFSTGKKLLVTKRNMRSGSGALSTWGTNLFVGREAKGLSKGRYDKTFAGEDGDAVTLFKKATFSFGYEHLIDFLAGGELWSEWRGGGLVFTIY